MFRLDSRRFVGPQPSLLQELLVLFGIVVVEQQFFSCVDVLQRVDSNSSFAEHIHDLRVAVLDFRILRVIGESKGTQDVRPNAGKNQQ
jgi:hypothetical protein